jgi:hypothetical protein
MKVKRVFIASALVWGIVVFGFSAGISAMPYQPDGSIRIITQSAPGETNSDVNRVEWVVTTKKTSVGRAELSFAMAGSDQPFCRLTIGASNVVPGNLSSASLLWNDPDRQPQVIQQGDILIVPGSPVPCDLLPLDMLTGKKDAKNFEIRREVAGQAFVDNFEVTYAGIDGATARKNGWLTGDDLSGQLMMITMRNVRTRELVVRQLWAPGADWWLFEETPYRQSWRVR